MFKSSEVLLDFLLDGGGFVLDLGVFDLHLAVFLLDGLILVAGFVIEEIEGGSLVLEFLLDGDRGEESWWHLRIREKVLQRHPVDIVGHAEVKRHDQYKSQLRRRRGDECIVGQSNDLHEEAGMCGDAASNFAKKTIAVNPVPNFVRELTEKHT